MNELVKFDLPELQSIEKSKAEKIKAAFEPMAKMLSEFEARYNKLMEIPLSEITVDSIKEYKRLRLDIGKVRIGTGKEKDKAKEYLKLEDKAIMGIHNILVWAVKEKEDNLKARENHFENIESERIRKLHEERRAICIPFVESEEMILSDLGNLSENLWDNYIIGLKASHEARIEAEKKAEAERIEAERISKLKNDRELLLRPYYSFVPENHPDFGELSIDEWKDFYAEMQDAKKAQDKKQAVIAAENKRLHKEREEAKKKAFKDMDNRRISAISFLLDNGFEAAHGGHKAKEYQHFIGALHYSEFESDKELELFKNGVLSTKEKEEAMAELKKKQDAEKAELEQIKKDNELKAAQEKAAALAPEKDKITAWIDSFEINKIESNEFSMAGQATVNLINQKFEAFKKWAIDQKETIK